MPGRPAADRPIQRPGQVVWEPVGLGRNPSHRQRKAGSRSTPVGSPFSQKSHQRSASCRKPICGPGTAKCGYLWAQGPMIALQGLRRPAHAAAARHWNRHRSSRRRPGPAPRWRRSPRRPSRASNRRRGADGCSHSAARKGSFSSRSSHMSRQRSPTSTGSGGREE